jgi:phage terminase small subunit
MVKRCYDKSDKRFSDWGGRGITVCDRWRYSYANFLKDMGKRPKDKSSLVRKYNDGNYCPENCRWATNKEQCNNTRKNVEATLDGITKTVSEWCELYNISVSSAFDRINKRGWTPEEAISIPMLKHRHVKIGNEIKTVSQWSKLFGIHPQSVNRSIRKGMSPEEALLHIRNTTWKKK